MEKILILGGTNFIGRNLIERLITIDKYDLTLLNRGKTNANSFPNIKQIKGDRNKTSIGELVKGDWDYIIDLSCYFPKSLERVVAATNSRLKKYIFISTISVFKLGVEIPVNENTPLKVCQPEDWKDETNRTYGERKVACEEILKASPLNYAILRPAVVYGKYDHTDRFYYWLHQVKKYKKVLLPNDGKQQFSLTYIDDLITVVEGAINDTKDKEAYNIISHKAVTIKQIVALASQQLNKNPNLINLSHEYLQDKKMIQWRDLPLWITGDYLIIENQKMLASFDLEIVSFEKSIAKTIAYCETLNWPKPTYGINRRKQLALINNYKD